MANEEKDILPPNFKWEEYLRLNADLIAAGLTTEEAAIQHWTHFGKSENRVVCMDPGEDKVRLHSFYLSPTQKYDAARPLGQLGFCHSRSGYDYIINHSSYFPQDVVIEDVISTLISTAHHYDDADMVIGRIINPGLLGNDGYDPHHCKDNYSRRVVLPCNVWPQTNYIIRHQHGTELKVVYQPLVEAIDSTVEEVQWQPLVEKTKRALVLDNLTPTIDRDSGSNGSYHLMMILLKLGYHVVFLPAGNMARLEKYTADMQLHGVEVVYSSYYRTVAEYLELHGHEFDLVKITRFEVAELCFHLVRQYCPNAKIIFDTLDLVHLRLQREAMLVGDATALAAAHEIEKKELFYINSADMAFVISPYELALLPQDIVDKIRIMPLIIEMPQLEWARPIAKEIFFIGGYCHRPNPDAVKWFLDEIWSVVRESLPEAIFNIIGPDYPKELRQDLPINVKHFGYLESLDPVVPFQRASVVPLRYGAGNKGKIATSMSYGIPVVTTSVGAEGMGLTHGENVFIANTPAEFAYYLSLLFADDELWQRMSTSSRAFSETNHSIENAQQLMVAALTSLGE